FLTCANFGKRSVAFGVEIDLERLLVRSDIHLRIHRLKMGENAYISNVEGTFASRFSAVAPPLIGAQRPLPRSEARGAPALRSGAGSNPADHWAVRRNTSRPACSGP